MFLSFLALVPLTCHAATTTTTAPATTTTTTSTLQQPSAIDMLRGLGAQQQFETSDNKNHFTDPTAIEAAADRGDAIAQYNMGHQYESGQGAGKNLTEAAKWYRKSAQQGYARAQYNLGFFYDQGLGVPQDYEQAYFWWTLAAKSEASYVSKRDSLELFLSSDQIASVHDKVAAWKPVEAAQTATKDAESSRIANEHKDCQETNQSSCDDENFHGHGHQAP